MPKPSRSEAGLMLDQLRGLPYLRPADTGYDNARSVWNAIVDHRPAVIRCGGA